MWLRWWNGYCFSGSPSLILAHKLKTLKEDFKKWNKEEFEDLAFRNKFILSELLGLDAREDLSGLSQEEQLGELRLKVRLHILLLWRRSLGDKSPKYFL